MRTGPDFSWAALEPRLEKQEYKADFTEKSTRALAATPADATRL
jgi:hypothetical protein